MGYGIGGKVQVNELEILFLQSIFTKTKACISDTRNKL